MTETYRIEFTEAELKLLEHAVWQEYYSHNEALKDDAPALYSLFRRILMRQEVV